MKQTHTHKQKALSKQGFGSRLAMGLFVAIAMFLNGQAQAQTFNGRILSFDFSNATTTPAYAQMYSAAAGIDTAGSGLTRSATYTVSNLAGFYALNNNVGYGASSNDAAAVSDAKYIQFKVKTGAGIEARLDSLIWYWKYENTTNGTTINFFVRTSNDAFATTVGLARISSGTNGLGTNTKRSIMTFTNPVYVSDSVTLRLYIWHSDNTNRGVWFGDTSANASSVTPVHDIQLWGRTAAKVSFIQAFDFTGQTGTQSTNRVYAFDTTHIDTAGVVISRGGGVTAPSTASGSYGAANFNTNTLANAISTGEFFQFALKPKFGYEYELDRIFIRYNSGSGLSNYALRSSQDNYANNLATGTLTTGSNTTGMIQLTTPLASDSAITYRLYLWRSSGTTNTTFRFTDGTGTSSFNYDIAMYGYLSTANIPSAVLSADGSTTACLGGGINLKFSVTGGTPPFTLWLKDNLGQTRSHVQSGPDSTITLYPQSNRTYTLDSVKDVMGHKALSATGSVAVTITASPVVSGVGVYSRTLNHLNGYNLTYADGAICRSILNINDSVGGTNPGSTTVTASVLSATPTNGTSRYFIARHLRIQPTTNGVANVTLFYTQSEFTGFNTAGQYHQKLPTSPIDTVGVLSKIRISRTQNSIETDSLTTFSPSAVVWNSTNSQWEVSFRVNDGILGGYYYITTPFNTLKMVSNITHLATTPTSGATAASVTVSWDSVAGVNQYRFRFRPQGGTWNASTVTGKQRVMGNLSFNTTYEVQVRVFESQINQFMQGEYTRTYTFTTPAEPNKMPACVAPPVSATVNNPISATLTWPSVAEGVSYFVQIRAKNTLTWGGSSTTGNAETFNALTPNTTYEYRIRTTCTPGMTLNGISEFSPIDTFRTPGLENCGDVTNVTVVSTTNNTATLSWTAVPYATSYLVQTRLKNTETWGGSSTATNSIILNNLSAASNYEFRIRPTCNQALALTVTGSFTALGEFTTLGQVQLATCLPPTNIQAFPTSNNITLTWNGTANDTTYFVQLKREDATTWGGGSTATTSRTMNNLQANTAYHIRIRTTCKPGTTTSVNSAFSDTVFVVTTPIANKFEADVMDQTAIRVYPNPTRDWLHIDYTSQTEEKIQVIVRDMTGRIISTTQVNPMIGENPIDVNLQQATEGLYLVQIFQGNSLKFTNKIQKQ